MKYGDEEIIELINKHKKYPVGDIYSGIKINGEMFHFHEHSLFNNKLNIMLPLRFIEMPRELVKLKYANMPTPQTAKTSLDYSMDMTFYLTSVPLEDESIEQNLVEQMQMLKELQPGYEIYEKNVEDNGYIKFGWYDFKGYAIDTILYNLVFVLSIDGYMMYGKYNCSIYKSQYWKSVVLQMLYSINNKDRIIKKYVMKGTYDYV